MPFVCVPFQVVDRDLDYAATVQLLEHRDWAMFERLQGGGLRVAAPQDADHQRQAQQEAPPQSQSAAPPPRGMPARSPPSDNDLFALDM